MKESSRAEPPVYNWRSPHTEEFFNRESQKDLFEFNLFGIDRLIAQMRQLESKMQGGEIDQQEFDSEMSEVDKFLGVFDIVYLREFIKKMKEEKFPYPEDCEVIINQSDKQALESFLSIPYAVRIDVFKKIAEWYEKKTENLDSRVRDWKIRFINQFQAFQESLLFGLDVDQAEIVKRLDVVKILPQINPRGDNTCSGGYVGVNALITVDIDTQIDEKFLYTNFAHEVLHHISGKILKKTEVTVDYNEEDSEHDEDLVYQKKRTDVFRNGLSFSWTADTGEFKTRLVWLNEAFTEGIATRLEAGQSGGGMSILNFDPDEMDSYRAYGLIAQAFIKGISVKTGKDELEVEGQMVQLYFSDWQSREYADFSRLVDQAFGSKGSLKKIDKMVGDIYRGDQASLEKLTFSLRSGVLVV